MHYYNKSELFMFISDLRKFMGFSENENIDVIKYCRNQGKTIEFMAMRTKGLRGVISIGASPKDDVIILNSNRNRLGTNFDCTHEFMHSIEHRDLENKIFNCFDTINIEQNPYIEWQANEGAAELLICYKRFLRYIYSNQSMLNDVETFKMLLNRMAVLFNTSQSIIINRFIDLRYEIYQLLSGEYLDKISILSKSQQERLGIDISLPEVVESFISEAWYKSN